MQLVILGFSMTYQPGQPGSTTYHLNFEYSTIRLLTICFAMVAVLFVNSVHIGWMVHSQKTRSLSWLEPAKPNFTSNTATRPTEAEWKVMDWVQRQI